LLAIQKHPKQASALVEAVVHCIKNNLYEDHKKNIFSNPASAVALLGIENPKENWLEIVGNSANHSVQANEQIEKNIELAHIIQAIEQKNSSVLNDHLKNRGIDDPLITKTLMAIKDGEYGNVRVILENLNLLQISSFYDEFYRDAILASPSLSYESYNDFEEIMRRLLVNKVTNEETKEKISLLLNKDKIINALNVHNVEYRCDLIEKIFDSCQLAVPEDDLKEMKQNGNGPYYKDKEIVGNFEKAWSQARKSQPLQSETPGNRQQQQYNSQGFFNPPQGRKNRLPLLL